MRCTPSTTIAGWREERLPSAGELKMARDFVAHPTGIARKLAEE